MFAIFGLGNVGVQYENTYHNMGFKVVDLFAKKHGLTFTKKKCNALFCEGIVFGKKVMLFKPTTFMNNSGFSVYEAVKKFKIDLSHLVVVYDDVDIPVGQIRLRQNGSAGSHNGMKSIIENLGDSNFPRVRVGIKGNYYNLADYVLSPVREDHKQQLEEAIEQAVYTLEKFIMADGDVNRVH